MAVSQIDAHLGYLLRMVSNAVSHAFARKVEKEGVTVAEWVMLRSLYEGDAVPPSALASEMGMTRGAISKLADRLVSKGLVRREERDDDRRGRALSLTRAGSDKVPILAGLADENDRQFFSSLENRDAAALRELLSSLIRHHELAAMPID